MKRAIWLGILLGIMLSGVAFGLMVLQSANAATFQAWEYAAIQPSKLGTVEAVDASFAKYHAAYAAAHGGCWTGDCYFAAVTEWLHANGCASCYVNDKEMSFKEKVDYPNYAPSNLVVPPGAPEPWMYAAIPDSGLGTVQNVQASFYVAQVQYAMAHGGCWTGDCHDAVATEWLHGHGCANCYVKDGQLSIALKIGVQKNNLWNMQ